MRAFTGPAPAASQKLFLTEKTLLLQGASGVTPSGSAPFYIAEIQYIKRLLAAPLPARAHYCMQLQGVQTSTSAPPSSKVEKLKFLHRNTRRYFQSADGRTYYFGANAIFVLDLTYLPEEICLQ